MTPIAPYVEPIINSKSMNSATTQFVMSRNMGVYDRYHQMNMWDNSYKANGCPDTPASMIIEIDDIKLDNQSEENSHGTLVPSNNAYDQEETKPNDKVKRRLAQNREAARKSRLRKKAYVQQLESSRLKLIQMEQELEQARQQSVYMGGGLDASHLNFSGIVNPGLLNGIAAFERDYVTWVEEQTKQICELRNLLQSNNTIDAELRVLVEKGMSHYMNLFRMKAIAAKSDVFYLMSGLWKSPAERFFLWIGGFRPSDILKVLVPHLDPLTGPQGHEVGSLQHSCQQAEDALSQGMEKLQQTLSESVAAGQLGDGTYPHMATAMERLEALVSFVNQADHLRLETMQQMSCILTIRQQARCLLALGEYLERLRALSTLWATHPREPT